ncbi:MAG: glutathione S-transferase family protein [Gammaproteobacteria bacterium]|nr:glutathione S-transferase family protein [Gammaproteobacteria bacterium]
MAPIILHHYPPSLFSEKIRLLLGYLGLEWRSVIIPPTMPRPALMPLTGGYRRTPVMQEGADIYCDSRIIAERLAARAGRPELCAGFLANRVAEWADSHLFRIGVAIMFQPRAMVATMKGLSATDLATFQKDRAELSKGATLVSISPDAAESHLRGYLTELDASLDHPFLFGAEPTIADFSVYHCLWFVANNAIVAPILADYPKVTAWRARMAAFGHGRFTEMSAEEASRWVATRGPPW